MHATDVEGLAVEVGKGVPLRTLGALEHIFWLIDQERPMHFAVAAEIAGTRAPAEWRRALDLLQMRHPMLNVRIVARHGSVPLFCTARSPIPLRIVEVFGHTWQSVVGEELATPFDPDAAPLVRAVVISGDIGSTLVLVAHHAVADGMSLVFLVRDILRALHAAPLEALPMPPSQDELAALAEVQVRAGSDNGADAPPGAAGTFRCADGAHPTVRGRRLDLELTQRIRDRAREEGASVHGAVCAALAIAGRQLSTGWRAAPVRFLSPINTRPILAVGEDCGLFVSAVTIVSGPAEACFWDVARHASVTAYAGKSQRGLRALLDVAQSFVASRPDAQMACAFAARSFAREAFVTNLGALPIDTHYGDLELRAFWGPIVLSGFVGDQSIGLATIGGALHLTHASHDPFPPLLIAMELILDDVCAGA